MKTNHSYFLIEKFSNQRFVREDISDLIKMVTNLSLVMNLHLLFIKWLSVNREMLTRQEYLTTDLLRTLTIDQKFIRINKYKYYQMEFSTKK
jgi:hypothetical protein